MKNNFVGVIPFVILTVFLAEGVSASQNLPVDNPSLTHPKNLFIQQSQPESHLSIQATESGVRVRASNVTLQKLLSAIHLETNIRFDYPESLSLNLLNADIESDSWNSAMGEILRDYSRLELWSSLISLSRIKVIAKNRTSSETVSKVTPVYPGDAESLIRLAKESPDAKQRSLAIENFSFLESETNVLPLLILGLKDRSPEVRSTILTLMKDLSEPIPLNRVKEIAHQDPMVPIRLQALSLIAERASEDKAKTLLTLGLSDSSKRVREKSQSLLEDL